VQLTAVRQRSCPGCQRPVTERTARWCGACGEPLRAEAPTPRPREAGGRRTAWRRAAAAGAAVAVVGGLAVAGGPIVDRLPGDGTLTDLEVSTPSATTLDRVGRRFQPPPAALRDPVCLRSAGDGCFRWSVVDPDLAGAQVLVAGDLLLATGPSGRDATARRLDDGEVAWRAVLADGVRPDRVVATDTLLLTVDDGRLTARDLADGDVRWRDAPLPEDATILDARQRGDRIVVVAVREGHDLAEGPDDADAGLEQFGGLVLGIDARDGAATWEVESAGPPGVGHDATTVHVDEDGHLVALDPDGSVRWRVPALPEGASGGTWINGGFVTVWSDDGFGDRLHRLHDGQALGVGGTVLAQDGARTLLEVWPGEDEGGPAYVLVDGDEERWRVPAEASGCSLGADLDAEVARLHKCGGSELVLDAADGSVRSHSPPVAGDDEGLALMTERVGPFALRPEAPGEVGSAWNLVDTRTDTEVARLPPDSVLVTREAEPSWTADLGGVAVIQHRGGMVAVDLPAEEVAAAPADPLLQNPRRVSVRNR
jgi:hypothetical protein